MQPLGPPANVTLDRTRAGGLPAWLAALSPGGTERPSPDEARAFDQHRLAVSARIWPRLGLLLSAAALVWWPLDLVVFADDLRARAVFAVFRAVIIAVNLVLSVIGPRQQRLYPYGVPILSALVALEVAWAGLCMHAAGDGDPAWFGFFYLAPVFTVLILAPLGQRILAACLVSASAWLSFHLAGPTLPAGAAVAASQMGFATLVATALGHWLYQAIESQFVLRRRLDQEHQALGALTAELEDRVAVQTADLLALSPRAQRSRVDERRRVGQDLHDDLGQELTALGLRLESLGRGGGALDPAELAPVQELVTQARESLSRILDDLQPRLLDELGMEDAVRQLVDECCTVAELGWALDVRPVALPVSDAVALVVFRVVQEGLHNVVRHVRARSVRVSIAQEDRSLVLVLADDGVGVPPAEGKGRGCPIIRSRCAELGGTATWLSGPGTTLRVCLPLGACP